MQCIEGKCGLFVVWRRGVNKMGMPEHLWINGLWDRINDEIYRQHKTKKDIAERCGFNRKIFFDYNNPSLPILALLCKELNVSADYLLFGKKK